VRARRRCTCGAKYATFRTGLTFAAVKQLMYVGEADPTLWRNKSRRAVLGHWTEIKRQLWDEQHRHCPETWDACTGDEVVPFTTRAAAAAFAIARARRERRPIVVEVRAGEQVLARYAGDWRGRVRAVA
jgi:hypothetical protein